jgi:hypothetical protein
MEKLHRSQKERMKKASEITRKLDPEYLKNVLHQINVEWK